MDLIWPERMAYLTTRQHVFFRARRDKVKEVIKEAKRSRKGAPEPLDATWDLLFDILLNTPLKKYLEG